MRVAVSFMSDSLQSGYDSAAEVEERRKKEVVGGCYCVKWESRIVGKVTLEIILSVSCGFACKETTRITNAY